MKVQLILGIFALVTVACAEPNPARHMDDSGASLDASSEPDGAGDSGEGCVPCTPDCARKACGDDGCGGTCGTCNPNEFCLPSRDRSACFLREAAQCPVYQQCGQGPFGFICGECPTGYHCQDNRLCFPTNGCNDLPAGGACVLGWRVYCNSNQLEFDSCQWGCEEIDGGSRCKTKCFASCFGKTCGPDGCGDSCGSCSSGEECRSGVCVPANGACNAASPSSCSGHLLVGCKDGSVAIEDCLANGKVCGVDPCTGEPACIYAKGSVGCDGLPCTGVCIGEFLVWCDQYLDRLMITDCTKSNLQCVRTTSGLNACVDER